MIPVPVKSLGEVGQPGPDAPHGTLLGYYRGCRCEPCRETKMAQRRRKTKRVRGIQLDDPHRCQICHVPIQEHPMKACWRDLL